MTNVGVADILQRIEALRTGKARKPSSEIEKASMLFLASPSYKFAIDFLERISQAAAVRVYRPAVLQAYIMFHGEKPPLSLHNYAAISKQRPASMRLRL
jgi:hypothetical protein